MHRSASRSLLVAILLAWTLPGAVTAGPAQPAITPASSPQPAPFDPFNKSSNLQVLPETTTPAELRDTMRGFALGLGVRCNHCHVGENPADLRTFDFAADDKAEKRSAREMLKMVRRINREVLPGIRRPDPADRLEVACMTCHRGLPRPELIQDVLRRERRTGGAEAAIARYRELRARYYGSHSYDFSEAPLIGEARDWGRGSDASDGLALAEFAAELFPNSAQPLAVQAELLAAQGRRQEAIDAAERAAGIDPQSPIVQHLLRTLSAPEPAK